MIKVFFKGLLEGMGSVFDPLGGADPEPVRRSFHLDYAEALRADAEGHSQ